MAAVNALDGRPFDAAFSRTLITVTEAWARRRVLKLSYRSAGKTRPKDIILCPYFLEPSAAGFSTYVIGYSRTHQAMRTLKVERIVSAEKLPEAFQLPKNLDVDMLLGSAWGIIWGEGTVVRIRFAPDVAWRVRESRWHPTQSLEDLDGGGVIMTVTVATTMEIGRWVREWGDKAEVLEPITLREELRDEAIRLARQYTAKPRVEKRRGVVKKRATEAAPQPLLISDRVSS
jgi:predicted DNA-binding transcriptional regulator YafY